LKLLKILISVALLAAIACVAYYMIYPDVSKLKRENPKKTSFMEYREEEWKQKGRKLKIQKKWVPFGQISPYLVKAVIIAEDDKFWGHKGFDLDAIQKAIEKDIEKGSFKLGGSTISQQLVKNLYLTPSKNLLRKAKETIITWRIERNLSKRRILELYLNLIEWGEGIFGIEVASEHYYGKPAMGLTPQEAARLAAVLPNPRRFSPVGSSKYVEKKANIIYNIMVRRGVVVPEYEDVLKESVGIDIPSPLNQGQ
jgi:monofunctional glycosyltransferase